jgi:hypothetical protein
MKHGDRVQETTLTEGTGSLTLAGPTAGHQSFAAEIGEATECVHLTESCSDPSVWELSRGELTGTTLTRTLIKSSTGSLIDWAAGVKYVSQVLDAGTINGFGAGSALRHAWDSPYSYCGVAPAGAVDADETWTITRIELDADGDVVATLTATDVAWDDYLTAEYT